MDNNRHIKKEAILKALENSLGVVTVACKQTETPRSTYYKWLKEDKEYSFRFCRKSVTYANKRWKHISNYILFKN